MWIEKQFFRLRLEDHPSGWIRGCSHGDRVRPQRIGLWDPLPYMAVSWLVNGGYQLLTKWEPILQVGPASPGDRKCCWRCPYREMLRLQILEILGDIPS